MEINLDLLKEINFEDLKLSPEDRIKLPRRRDLSNRPWSKEQMLIFIERQKQVPRILAEMGIEIVGPVDYEKLKKEWDRSADGAALKHGRAVAER